MVKNIVVIGSSGAIGRAFVEQLSSLHRGANILAFARSQNEVVKDNVVYHPINYDNEKSIERAALMLPSHEYIDLVIVATGLLHDKDIMPEKSLQDISFDKFIHLFTSNTILPALIAKYFLRRMPKNKKAVFAVLSARVGSITDNQLGGWYSYRASKASLNMVIKNYAIEMKRSHKESIVIGLHPGTVDSELSKPFQANIPEGKLFTAEFAVTKLIDVINSLTPSDSGKCFAWDGKEVLP